MTCGRHARLARAIFGMPHGLRVHCLDPSNRLRCRAAAGARHRRPVACSRHRPAGSEDSADANLSGSATPRLYLANANGLDVAPGLSMRGDPMTAACSSCKNYQRTFPDPRRDVRSCRASTPRADRGCSTHEYALHRLWAACVETRSSASSRPTRVHPSAACDVSRVEKSRG